VIVDQQDDWTWPRLPGRSSVGRRADALLGGRFHIIRLEPRRMLREALGGALMAS
jgi:hypothetical protein